MEKIKIEKVLQVKEDFELSKEDYLKEQKELKEKFDNSVKQKEVENNSEKVSQVF